MANKNSFTGRRRHRTTRWTVALNNRLAHIIIATGGIGTIVAVSLVCVFLVWVVVPLFLPASVEKGAAIAGAQSQLEAEKPLAMGVDDYRLTGWEIGHGGDIRVFRLDNGQTIEHLTAQESALNGVTAASIAINGHSVAFGFADGSVRLGAISYDDKIVPPDELPEQARNIASGELALLNGGAVVTRTDQGQFRRQRFELKLNAP